MRTLDKIITKVNVKYGAPMGRPNIDDRPAKKGMVLDTYKAKYFDCAVPMSSNGDYDRGGAYWGYGKELRVKYTKDLLYIEFYRR